MEYCARAASNRQSKETTTTQTRKPPPPADTHTRSGKLLHTSKPLDVMVLLCHSSECGCFRVPSLFRAQELLLYFTYSVVIQKHNPPSGNPNQCYSHAHQHPTKHRRQHIQRRPGPKHRRGGRAPTPEHERNLKHGAPRDRTLGQTEHGTQLLHTELPVATTQGGEVWRRRGALKASCEECLCFCTSH